MHRRVKRIEGLVWSGEVWLLELVKSSRINWQMTGVESAELFGRSKRKHQLCFQIWAGLFLSKTIWVLKNRWTPNVGQKFQMHQGILDGHIWQFPFCKTREGTSDKWTSFRDSESLELFLFQNSDILNTLSQEFVEDQYFLPQPLSWAHPYILPCLSSISSWLLGVITEGLQD